MKFSFEFLYSFGPTHTRKIETEMILAAFNNIYITGSEFMDDAMFVHNGQDKRRNSDSIGSSMDLSHVVYSNWPTEGQHRTGSKSDIYDCLVTERDKQLHAILFISSRVVNYWNTYASQGRKVLRSAFLSLSPFLSVRICLSARISQK